jgi:hypothetical protein
MDMVVKLAFQLDRLEQRQDGFVSIFEVESWAKGGTSANLPVDLESESPCVNSLDEIDAWARQALASNGFGDY